MGPFGETPPPYAGLTDDAVLTKARTACLKAAGYPVGSIQRAIAWAAFDAAMAELERRAAVHVLIRLGLAQ